MLGSLNLETMASSYFVSANGNDSNVGTSKRAAWKTIDKLNHTKFKPGDEIFFHRGDLFVGQLKIEDSGKAGQPIAIGAYGAGAKPVLCGAVPIESWICSTNGIYTAHQTAAVTSVYVNDVWQYLARHPNTGFASIERGDKISLVDPKWLPAGVDLVGATVRIRACDWQYEVMKVASQHSNQIQFTKTMMYQCSPGYGYFLENKLGLLDSPGEWFYDQTRQTLYLMPPTNVPLANAWVDATIYGCGIIIESGVQHISIKDLEFTKYETAAVLGMRDSSHVSISDCTIRNIGVFGINLALNCDHYSIRNNQIEDIRGRGISLLECSDNEIVSNVVRRIGLFSGYGFDGVNNAIGINVYRTEVTYAISEEVFEQLKHKDIPPDVLKIVGTIVGLPYPDEKFLLRELEAKLGQASASQYSLQIIRLVNEELRKTGRQKLESRNNRVAYNVVETTGYNGIRLDGQDSIAECNIIKDTVLRMSDGGALYCWGQNANYTFNNILRSNIIIRAVGNNEGTPGNFEWGGGIYLDNKTHHISVENNTVMQCGSGIAVNDESHDQRIVGNTCYDNGCGIGYHEYLTLNSMVRCETYGNYLFAKNPKQRPLEMLSSLQENSRPTMLDSNIYGSAGTIAVQVTCVKNGSNQTRNFTLPEWQKYYGQDAHSKEISGCTSMILVNESNKAKTFKIQNDAKYCDLNGHPVAKEIELQPYASQILVRQR